MATLLIVEDDLDTNEAVCEYLQDAGHHTISAFDGDEAITLFSENKLATMILLCRILNHCGAYLFSGIPQYEK